MIAFLNRVYSGYYTADMVHTTWDAEFSRSLNRSIGSGADGLARAARHMEQPKTGVATAALRRARQLTSCTPNSSRQASGGGVAGVGGQPLSPRPSSPARGGEGAFHLR